MLTECQDGNAQVTIELGANGRVHAKSQVTDYMLRGEGLDSLNLLQFITDTYEGDRAVGEACVPAAQGGEGPRGPGRPASVRSHYQAAHPRAETRLRVVRSSGHRNLPNIIGRWFPRRDDDGVCDFYCASMLLLLKPWRDIPVDLKRQGQTWEEAFAEFEAAAPASASLALSGVQYFHECSLAADARRAEDAEAGIAVFEGNDNSADDIMDVDGEPGVPVEMLDMETEDGLRQLQASQVGLPERIYASLALEAGRHAGYFDERMQANWPVARPNSVGVASGDALRNLEEWKARLAEDVARQAQAFEAPVQLPTPGSLPAEVAPLQNALDSQEGPDASISASGNPLPGHCTQGPNTRCASLL